MIDLINIAVAKGARIFSNVSGGKDGQAMTNVLLKWGFKIEALVHADLGRIEWKESLEQCRKQAEREGLPLKVVTRKDGREMVDHWKHRMNKLKGTGKPFWSSSSNRYCTSDMKRDPIKVFYTSTGFDFIISCSGIRAEESVARAKKNPLSVCKRSSSKIYKGMTPDQAVAAFKPGKKLILNWYPIFNFTLEEVWNTEGLTRIDLEGFRKEYKEAGTVNQGWKFHPAYVYGNDRVSCTFCIMGCLGDLQNGAKFNPEVWKELVDMQKESGFLFRTDIDIETMTRIPGKKKKKDLPCMAA